MASTGTFSDVVNEVLLRSGRRDRIADIVSYARSTLRECQTLAYFEQDLVENVLTIDATPFIWLRPARFRTMLAAKPDIVSRRGENLFYKNMPPGTKTAREDFFLYLSGNSFIFSGLSTAVGGKIDVAHFTYSRKFVYYIAGTEPALFDPELEVWTYHPDYNVDATTQAAARELSTNWLVFDWYDLIVEGALAKVFKQVGDERSRTAFALYKQFQKDLMASERVIYLRNHDTNG